MNAEQLAAGAGGTDVRRSRRSSRRASAYRLLRRIHLVLALVTAVPLTVASLTGALLVFGHELEGLIRPATVVEVRDEPVLAYSTVLQRAQAQRPEAEIWALQVDTGERHPWNIWLKGGAGVLEVDPWSGDVLRGYRPADTPYNIVRALHRRWMMNSRPASDWSRTIISATALLVMVQVVLGMWLWLLPPKRLARLKPVFGANRRLLWQRLHMTSGVATALIMLAVAFTGLSMYWTETSEALISATLPGEVEQPAPPSTKGLAPVADLDAAVAMAHALSPEAAVAAVRPAEKPGGAVHVALRNPGTGVNSRVWIGGDPMQVLKFHDGRAASAATRFWHFRYWLHVGDFAGPVVRVLWLAVSLLPVAFVVSGIWLWRDRGRRRRRAAV